MFRAPQPRSRLYTTALAYGSSALSLLTGYHYDAKRSERLERALEAEYPGSYAVAAPMARVAIYLVLRNTIKPGQKVILSPYTISDVVNMVLCAGGIPVFADIEDGGTYNLSAANVKHLLEQESNVGAVLVTHFYGLICDIEPILAECRSRGIPLIEDAAQAFGARLNGKRAGTIGDAGVFSFGLLKNVTSFIGGAIVTPHKALAENVRRELAGYPTFPKRALVQKMAKGAAFDAATSPPAFELGVYWLFRHASLRGLKFFSNKLATDSSPVAYRNLPASYAYRMSGVQADLVQMQLANVDEHTNERIRKAKMYAEGLRGLSDVVLPPLRTDGSHIYFYYPIQCRERENLVRYMTERLRDIQISHHRNCAEMACFAEYARDCPNAARAERCVIYLPTYPGYRENEVLKNIETIRTFFQERTG